MTRLWRAATLILAATALVAGPASAVFATTGDDVGRDTRPGDSAPDRRAVGTATDVVVDQPEAPAVDTVTDRASDAASDRVTDREQRPECDMDRTTDRIPDCPDGDDEIRPALARCIHYVQNHTDLVIRRHLRWWYHVCHRIAWNHNHPM